MGLQLEVPDHVQGITIQNAPPSLTNMRRNDNHWMRTSFSPFHNGNAKLSRSTYNVATTTSYDRIHFLTIHASTFNDTFTSSSTTIMSLELPYPRFTRDYSSTLGTSTTKTTFTTSYNISHQRYRQPLSAHNPQFSVPVLMHGTPLPVAVARPEIAGGVAQ